MWLYMRPDYTVFQSAENLKVAVVSTKDGFSVEEFFANDATANQHILNQRSVGATCTKYKVTKLV